MAISAGVTLSVLPTQKRERLPKYKGFGDLLKEWRGERDIETVVRLVRNEGLDFDGATLRGWEYGWIGRPDPLRLLALANVYGRSAADVMRALSAARGIKSRDPIRHARTGGSDPHLTKGGPDVPASDAVEARVREFVDRAEKAEQERDLYRQILAHVGGLAADITTTVRAQGIAPTGTETPRGRSPRKHS